jgi:hypothetical protein
MTGLAESTWTVESSENGEVTEPVGPVSSGPSRRPHRFAWRALGILAGGFASGLAIAWFIFLGPGQVGSKAQWFFGAAVFVAILVSIWQMSTIHRRANAEAASAAQRLEAQVAAAEERSARELAAIQSAHQAEIKAQQTLHHAEMQAQQELARVSRLHLLGQLQKQAMVDVSRAVSAHAQMLAALWNQASSVLLLEDRAEREQAMNPIFEQIGQVVSDFSVELTNAHMVIDDDRMHQALDSVNEAVLTALRVAEEVHVAVVDGHAPEPNPVPGAQQLMNRRAAEARHLAWELLRTGLNNDNGT